jgi:hypothetical protein
MESYSDFRRTLNLHDGVGAVDVLAAIRALPDPPSPAPRRARRSGSPSLAPDEELTLPPGATRDVLHGLSSLQSDNFVVDDRAVDGRPAQQLRWDRAASQLPHAPRREAPLSAATENAVEPFTEGVDEESVLGLLPD